jgi:hypothetical protein
MVNEFRNLVKKGQEQFKKELEAIAPEVSIGQHGKPLSHRLIGFGMYQDICCL